MADSQDQNKQSRKNPAEAGKDVPINHPSQAEGERRTNDPDALTGKDPGERKRPSQAEGER